MQDILKEAEDQMKKSVESTQNDFHRIRTGRANPLILEPVTVDYYGTETPINQVATVSVPEPRQLLIKPYDKSMIGEIEKAIQKSDLGVTPNNDGEAIRLTFPAMTEDRRKDLVKQVHSRAEEGRVSVRNARRDAIQALKARQKDGDISEDEQRGGEKKVQDLTDRYVAKVDEITDAKDKEVMEI